MAGIRGIKDGAYADESGRLFGPDEPGSRSFWFQEKDGGFTSAGVVIALALTIALLFTSAQVYWLNSTAGDIQFAADAGALAAENVVAEYYVIARIADAVVLSLSLFGTAVFGIAIVVSCIPYVQSIGVELMKFGENVFKVRDRCADQAQTALVNLQKALPFLSAANASAVISANTFSSAGVAQYQGLAILVPLQGEEAPFADDDAMQDIGDTLSDQNDKTRKETDEAEDAKKEMNQAKLDGYRADCGSEPNYCLYERAGKLAGLNGAKNPYFSSVELWKFDYAFERAKAYYARRLANEAPANATLEEQVRSFARKQYYSYAVKEMNKGYAHTDADGVLDAYFPLLANNNAEVRKTSLYTDRVFPTDGGGFIHGVSSCPGVEGGIVGNGSISDLDNGLYRSCQMCGLDINTIGRVASATTSTNVGFEYHYRIVANAAERYAQASKKYREDTREAKESAGKAFDSYRDALEALKTTRLNPEPPGRNGCIVIAFDISSHRAPPPLTSGFVSSDAQLPPRLALSAAALVEDEASEGNSVIASFLDRAKAQMGQGTARASVLGVFDGVLDIWSNALLAYSNGVDSLARGLGDFLRGIPLVSATPLASWAENALQDVIESFGLQGVNLSAPKPVVVNSIHVIRAGDSNALGIIAKAKETYSSLPGSGSGTITDAVIDGLLVEIQQQAGTFLESEITIYTISFGDMPGLPQIPIKVKLPQGVIDTGKGLLERGLDQVRSFLGGGARGKVWE